LGELMKEFEGDVLSFLKHGSPFWGSGCRFHTILYTKRRLPVKTNSGEILGKGSC
jgi:hypothetical protein